MAPGEGPGVVGRMLSRDHDRRSAQFLSLHHQQSRRGDAGEATQRRRDPRSHDPGHDPGRDVRRPPPPGAPDRRILPDGVARPDQAAGDLRGNLGPLPRERPPQGRGIAVRAGRDRLQARGDLPGRPDALAPKNRPEMRPSQGVRPPGTARRRKDRCVLAGNRWISVRIRRRPDPRRPSCARRAAEGPATGRDRPGDAPIAERGRAVPARRDRPGVGDRGPPEPVAARVAGRGGPLESDPQEYLHHSRPRSVGA